MAQFDVHRNSGRDARHIPYLLDVQSDLISRVGSRIVVPLVHAAMFGQPTAARLYPEFVVEGMSVIMVTTDLASVLRSDLGSKADSLADKRDAIRDALDFAFQGF
jgi:toxin CcdB